MTSTTEDRRGQLVLAILGAVANVLGVVQFAGSHLPVYVVGVLVFWVLLFIYGRTLWGFLRRHRRDLLFLVLGAVLSAAGIEGPRLLSSHEQPVITEPEAKREIVYRTPSGERYHRADCQYVKGKRIAISLKDAKAAGLTPCKVCRPPK